MGRASSFIVSALTAFMAFTPGSALAEDIVVQDGSGSYRYPADCAAAFENHDGIERYMRARGREGELNAFNHHCSVYLSGGPVAQTGTGIRALGSDMFDQFWRQSGARDLVNRLKQ